MISLEDPTGLTLVSCQTSLITASRETQKYRILTLRVYIIFRFFSPYNLPSDVKPPDPEAGLSDLADYSE